MGGKYGSHPGPTTHSSDAEAVELEASGVQSMSHTCDGTTRLAVSATHLRYAARRMLSLDSRNGMTRPEGTCPVERLIATIQANEWPLSKC